MSLHIYYKVLKLRVHNELLWYVQSCTFNIHNIFLPTYCMYVLCMSHSSLISCSATERVSDSGKLKLLSDLPIGSCSNLLQLVFGDRKVQWRKNMLVWMLQPMFRHILK
jgi:hypothetical protein